MITVPQIELDRGLRFQSRTIQWKRWFVISSGGILFLTGLAKLLAFSGKAKILYLADPIFGISFRYMMLFAGVLEVAIAMTCLALAKHNISVVLIILLAINLVGYRVALWLVGWDLPCPCLGNLTEVLHISSRLADSFMKMILAYLLIGGTTILLLCRKV